MNEQNLIPSNKRTESERRAMAKKAGKASGEARRARKQFQEAVLAALEAVTDDGHSVLENIVAAQISKALKGDTRAFEVMRDTSGEKPAEKVEAKVTNDNKELMKDYLHSIKKG